MKARDKEAEDARDKERIRCLWVLDNLLAELQQQLNKKVLVESEIHVIKVKVQLATAIVRQAKHRILRGDEPPSTKTNGTPTEDRQSSD